MAAPGTQPSSRLNDYIPASDVIPPLAACLALVRPVSMTEEAAAEWLAVAANELAGYRRGSVLAALSEARKRCTHHGQIVAFTIKEMEDSQPWRLGKPLDRKIPGAAADALPPPEIRGLIANASRSLSATR